MSFYQLKIWTDYSAYDSLESYKEGERGTPPGGVHGDINDKRSKFDKINDIISENLITGSNRRSLDGVVQYEILHKKFGSICVTTQNTEKT